MLVAKTATDALALSDTIRKTATAVDDSVAVFRSVTLADHLADGVVANRLTATLVATCGVMAFVLAVVGVYGTVAYAVVRRTREVGVRVALGATPGQVMALFAREGGRVIVLGAAAGVLGALASTRLLQSLLYGVSATDLATFVAVPLAVGAIGMIATCIPAARALRISPIAALRDD
jgi:putative ABC transport system permease protein